MANTGRRCAGTTKRGHRCRNRLSTYNPSGVCGRCAGTPDSGGTRADAELDHEVVFESESSSSPASGSTCFEGTWKKLAKGKWGVALSGDTAAAAQNRRRMIVNVVKRSGGTSTERVEVLVNDRDWDGNPIVLCELVEGEEREADELLYEPVSEDERIATWPLRRLAEYRYSSSHYGKHLYRWDYEDDTRVWNRLASDATNPKLLLQMTKEIDDKDTLLTLMENPAAQHPDLKWWIRNELARHEDPDIRLAAAERFGPWIGIDSDDSPLIRERFADESRRLSDIADKGFNLVWLGGIPDVGETRFSEPVLLPDGKYAYVRLQVMEPEYEGYTPKRESTLYLSDTGDHDQTSVEIDTRTASYTETMAEAVKGSDRWFRSFCEVALERNHIHYEGQKFHKKTAANGA